MTSQLRFPDELLSSIFNYLDRRRDKSTVAALRQSSKHFHRLADILLFCTITDNIRQTEAPDGDLQHRTWDIVRNLDLGRFIKAVHMRTWDFLGQDNLGTYKAKTNDSPTREQLALAVQQTNLPPDLKELIQEKLLEASSAANLSLLLALCPNIEVLEIQTGFEAVNGLLKRTFLHATNSSKLIAPQDLRCTEPLNLMLHSLRNLSMGASNYETSICDALPFLSLANLQQFSIYGFADNSNCHDHAPPLLPVQNDERVSKCLDLHFDGCTLSGQGLSYFLAACRRLQSLTARWRPGLWNEHLTNESIGEALRQNGSTLKSLLLDTTDVANHRYRVIPSPFGSFHPLTSIVRLAIPRFALKDPLCRTSTPGAPESYDNAAAILPSSLEELYVLGVDEDEMHDHGTGDLDSLVGDPQLPNLKTVVKVPWHHYGFEEWFGWVNKKCVDYNSLTKDGNPELGLKNFSTS